MTNLEALKKLAAALIGIIADEVPGKTTAEVIEYIAKFKAGEILGEITVTSTAGTAAGTTKISVTPALTSGNTYVYRSNPTALDKPEYLDDASAYTAWNGKSDITVEDGHYVGIYEVNSEKQVLKFGQAKANVNLG